MNSTLNFIGKEKQTTVSDDDITSGRKTSGYLKDKPRVSPLVSRNLRQAWKINK